jgi:MFS transporter, ACS family, aldohexuronate transporter
VGKWRLCFLLMLATMLNYMDRLTLNNAASYIILEFGLTREQYGQIDSAFAWSYAFSLPLAGILADRLNVKWLYALGVFAWSLAGFAAGYAQSTTTLIICRILLGLAESVNWPCAIRITATHLQPEDRSLGNGLFNSGAALGAVITPLLVNAMAPTLGWRGPFRLIGLSGLLWVGIWLVAARRLSASPSPGRDVVVTPKENPHIWPEQAGWWEQFREVIQLRIFWVSILISVVINLCWHFFRAWLPIYLLEERSFIHSQAAYTVAAFYLAADLGSIGAGYMAKDIGRRTGRVQESRKIVFTACCLFSALSLVVGLSSQTHWLFYTALFLLGFGCLGQFAIYFTLTQDIAPRYTSFILGIAGCLGWIFVALSQPLAGWLVDHYRTYAYNVAFIGLVPLIGCWSYWKHWQQAPQRSVPPAELKSVS